MNAVWKALVWLDRWVNDKILRGRWETISSRCYRRMAHGCRFCSWMCAKLERIDPGHCKLAYYYDRAHGNQNNLPWI